MPHESLLLGRTWPTCEPSDTAEDIFWLQRAWSPLRRRWESGSTELGICSTETVSKSAEMLGETGKGWEQLWKKRGRSGHTNVPLCFLHVYRDIFLSETHIVWKSAVCLNCCQLPTNLEIVDLSLSISFLEGEFHYNAILHRCHHFLPCCCSAYTCREDIHTIGGNDFI